ncbi:hypothetical protein [Arthrobacter sp. Rue61a]|uniref:hypothetical protein n=1 Tax=Arthrobacter sp. Rue61a TaxID=1118963 RepID=UPI00027DFE71|nr:hypothetical protein [Arthrobacter sp. Rue61a]AFR29900.1 hypothetical protein ARUE_c30150 [Arthrobacter sp. Rue61a]
MSQQFPYPEQTPHHVPLDYWIASGPALMAPSSAPSVLRDMAWNRGQYLGLAVACLGAAGSMLGAALLVLLLAGNIGVVIAFACVGLLLVCIAAGLRSTLNKVPRIRPVLGSRAPGKFSSGLWFAAFLSLIFGIGLFPVVSPLLERGPGHVLGFIAAYALLLLATVSLFAAPAYFSQHAREHFRARIGADPELRRSLEAMSLTWRDPAGNRPFGPL